MTLATLRCWWNAVTFEHIADRTLRDLVAKFAESISDGLFAPARVVGGVGDDELFDFLGYALPAS